MKNADIVKARIALAKLAHAYLPAPILMRLDPTLSAAEAVIDEAGTYPEDSEEGARYLAERADVPACAVPALPEIRMSWVDFDVLRGIVEFEEVG